MDHSDKLLVVLKKYGEKIHGTPVRDMSDARIHSIWRNILVADAARFAVKHGDVFMDGNDKAGAWFEFANGCILNVYFNDSGYDLMCVNSEGRYLSLDSYDLVTVATKIAAL